MNITVSLWFFIVLCMTAWWGVVSILLALCIGVRDWRNSDQSPKDPDRSEGNLTRRKAVP
jgi:hypothetical protein